MDANLRARLLHLDVRAFSMLGVEEQLARPKTDRSTSRSIRSNQCGSSRFHPHTNISSVFSRVPKSPPYRISNLEGILVRLNRESMICHSQSVNLQ